MYGVEGGTGIFLSSDIYWTETDVTNQSAKIIPSSYINLGRYNNAYSVVQTHRELITYMIHLYEHINGHKNNNIYSPYLSWETNIFIIRQCIERDQ